MSLSTLASLGMAIGAPLVYADQAYSIYRKQDARGFSHDVCAVLLIANITRCFFWLGERFEFALLLQSLLMIGAQLGLLYLCIRFKPVTKWSTSIRSDGARVVFSADAEEDGQRDGQQRQAHRNGNGIGNGGVGVGGSSGSAEHDLMDLNEADEEAGEEYANKQPLLVTLGAMFRSSSSSTAYGRLSSTDHASYSSSNANSLPAPNTTTTTTNNNNNNNTRSRLASIRSQLSFAHGRPLNFWQWSDYNSYLVFLALFSLLLLLLYVVLASSATFVALLGYVALGLESTLPIPQLIANHRRKSLAGFRASVLVGWLGGDSFKLLYFLLRQSPVQFTSCAIFQLSIDVAILVQSRLYRDQTQKEEEEMRAKAEAKKSAQSQAEIEEDITDDAPPPSTGTRNGRVKSKATQTKGKGRSAEAQELLEDPQHVISIEADEDEDEGDLSNARR